MAARGLQMTPNVVSNSSATYNGAEVRSVVEVLSAVAARSVAEVRLVVEAPSAAAEVPSVDAEALAAEIEEAAAVAEIEEAAAVATEGAVVEDRSECFGLDGLDLTDRRGAERVDQ